MFPIWINDGSTPRPDCDIYYIVGKDGIHLHKKLGMIESCIPVDKISILEQTTTYANLNVGKIDNKVFSRIVSLFREVLKKSRGETNVILHYNETTDHYIVEVPEQIVTYASVKYKTDIEMSYDGYNRIGTIHSHCDFSAFHSGTDKNDEFDWDGLHITVGHIDDDNIEISASVVVNAKRFLVDPEDYIADIPVIETESKAYNYGWYFGKKQGDKVKIERRYKVESVDFPLEWIDNVDTPSSAYSNPNSKFYKPPVTTNVKTGTLQMPLDFSSHTGHIMHDLDDDWNPCQQCPYKENKVSLMLEDLVGLDDDELDALGFKDDDDDDIDLSGKLSHGME